MSEIERFVEQLKNIHDGNAWHGASFAEALGGITFERATARPVKDAHSIWEIVRHIAAWEDVFRRRLEGEGTTEPEAGNFPAPVELSEKAWAETLENLESVHKELLQTIAELPDSVLDQTINGKDYSYRFLLREIVNHKIYHTGQIALLKKAHSD